MKTTLQARLITLLVLSSLLLISAFTAIQLKNQIQLTNDVNIYQAKQAAFLARNRLQEIFLTYGESTSEPLLMSEIKNIFRSLLESGTVETVCLLTKEGHPAILEGDLKLFFEDEKTFTEKVSADKENWLIPVIDKDHRLVNIFIKFKNPSGYILKITFSLGSIQKSLNAVYGPIIITASAVIIVNIILGIILSFVIIAPIKVLNQATKDVASGNLDLKIRITTKDELEELSDTFNYMTIELQKMKQKAENANPLTKLPGNIVIQEEVESRIKNKKKFVLVYCDLDNFKAFNDKYGVHFGDKAIMLTADVIKKAVLKDGKKDDFVGHEGGDDFLILTAPECADKIASYIITEFDKKIRSIYSQEDLEKGYIEAKTRGVDKIVKFPIMTISLAGVSNVRRDINSYAQLTNIAAEVKKAAKKVERSNFVFDRRENGEEIA